MKSRVTLLPALIICLVVACCLPSCNVKKTQLPVEVANDTIYPLGFCTDSFDMTEGVLKSGEMFATLMTKLGMGSREAHNLALYSDTLFNMKSMRAGNNWHAYYTSDSTHVLSYMIYEQDRINATVFKCTEPYEVWKVAKEVQAERKFADVTISSSLWNDMRATGVSPLLILNLSDIYAWTIDFFALQKGDRFRVIYSQSVCEGEVFSVDSVFFAVFDHNGKEFPAILFDQNDGGNLYWNEAGESMRKAFLKAPLQFKRISSGFSYHRKHPVTGVVKAHTGVDYSAPTGTPVVSIGDGTVISKGWGGGGGNTIKIRHNSVYTTAYLHLSRYAKGLQAGSRVRQGEVIGYVGATGTATGPHLDFRVWKNGSPINPLTMDSPSAEPIKPDNKASLDSVYTVLRHELDSLTAVSEASSPDHLADTLATTSQE